MNYMLHATDIVGYTFQADNHCEECIRRLGIQQALAAGSGMMWGDCGSAEDTLAEWASYIGLDRSEDFDTSDFPRPIFANQVEGREHCGTCRQPLIDSDVDLPEAEPVHVDYPHNPGWLDSCSACTDGECMCGPTTAQCVSSEHGTDL